MKQEFVEFIIPTLVRDTEMLVNCKNSIISQEGLFGIRIFVEKGFGFATNVNSGIKKGKSKYVALINDDVILAKDWLTEALRVLKSHPDCAAAATKVLTFDGKYIDSCGMDILKEGKAIKRGDGFKNDKSCFNNIEEVFGVPCSAALFQREALHKVGLFDEDFNSYEEDVDISFRLRLLGFKIFYASKAVAFHKIHATSSELANFKAKMDAKNWIFIILKNYPSGFIMRFAPYILIERLRNLSGLIKETYYHNKWKSIWIIPLSFIATYKDVITKFPNMMQKRKKIQKTAVIKYSDMMKWMAN